MLLYWPLLHPPFGLPKKNDKGLSRFDGNRDFVALPFPLTWVEWMLMGAQVPGISELKVDSCTRALGVHWMLEETQVPGTSDLKVDSDTKALGVHWMLEEAQVPRIWELKDDSDIMTLGVPTVESRGIIKDLKFSRAMGDVISRRSNKIPQWEISATWVTEEVMILGIVVLAPSRIARFVKNWTSWSSMGLEIKVRWLCRAKLWAICSRTGQPVRGSGLGQQQLIYPGKNSEVDAQPQHGDANCQVGYHHMKAVSKKSSGITVNKSIMLFRKKNYFRVYS